jgi:transcriptional regulator with XRE-family HTH domain
VNSAPVSKRELMAYQADLKGTIFRQIRQTFARLKQSGFTQKDLATKIGMNEGQLSRRLRGDYDLRLETLSDLARGLGCRIDVKLTPVHVGVSLTSEHAARPNTAEIVSLESPDAEEYVYSKWQTYERPKIPQVRHQPYSFKRRLRSKASSCPWKKVRDLKAAALSHIRRPNKISDHDVKHGKWHRAPHG